MIGGVIFDKDGTLFDFRQSWGAWTRALLEELAPQATGDLAKVLGFSPREMRFAPDSPVIAHTTPEIAAMIHPLLPGLGFDALNAKMNALAAAAPMVPAVDLPEVLGALKARGLRLGLATNDTEIPARTHLDGAGVLELFDFVAGCDSGWGGKPAPGQLLAFAGAVGLPTGAVAMVGDSLHDLDAARRAGMAAVGVLTGPATREVLTPHADVVLDTIEGLGPWIDTRNAARA